MNEWMNEWISLLFYPQLNTVDCNAILCNKDIEWQVDLTKEVQVACATQQVLDHCIVLQYSPTGK